MVRSGSGAGSAGVTAPGLYTCGLLQPPMAVSTLNAIRANLLGLGRSGREGP